MALILLTIAVVAIVMLAMSVGAMFSNRCLRGSCGGPDLLGPDGNTLRCGACPRHPGAESLNGRAGARPRPAVR